MLKWRTSFSKINFDKKILDCKHICSNHRNKKLVSHGSDKASATKEVVSSSGKIINKNVAIAAAVY